MRMGMFGLALMLAATATLGADIGVRDLVRGRVTECITPAATPLTVIIQQVDTDDGPVDPGFSVEGPVVDAGIVCHTVDSYINGQADGTLIEVKDGAALSAMIYDAVITDGDRTYSVADYVDMVPATANGARYYATSRVLVATPDPAPVMYPIDFIRRQQAFVADIPATIFMVSKDLNGSTLLFTLDYRDR